MATSVGSGPLGETASGDLPLAWVSRLTAVRHEPDPAGAAPGADDLDAILTVAASVPDHGGLRPWRFVVVEGAGRERWADALEAGLVSRSADPPSPGAVAKMRGKAVAAPCAVVLVSSPDRSSTVALWEQEASAACTGYAVVLAATGLGYGAVWKSASVLESEPVRRFFGLAEGERLLGWVNLGSPAPLGRAKADRPADAARQALEGKVRRIAG